MEKQDTKKAIPKDEKHHNKRNSSGRVKTEKRQMCEKENPEKDKIHTGKQEERTKLGKIKIDKQESQSCEGGNAEKQAKECKREQQKHEIDGKVQSNKEETEGERRIHQGKKKEEKQNSETEQGNKVNVCQDKMDTPQNFNQKRGNAESGNEAHEERISKDDTGKQKCESHGTTRREKQVGDCSQLSNGATEKRNKETREGNPKVIQGKRSRNTRKRRNISVSDSDITSPVKKKPSIDQHQCHVRSPSDAAVQYIKDRSSLPFPGASRGFCTKQNKKAISNAKRTRQREQLPVTRDEIKLVGMQRNRVDGSLEQNISIINKELMCCKN